MCGEHISISINQGAFGPLSCRTGGRLGLAVASQVPGAASQRPSQRLLGGTPLKSSIRTDEPGHFFCVSCHFASAFSFWKQVRVLRQRRLGITAAPLGGVATSPSSGHRLLSASRCFWKKLSLVVVFLPQTGRVFFSHFHCGVHLKVTCEPVEATGQKP